MADKNLDFDRIIERKNTDSVKYDLVEKSNMPEDIIPMWVADMDFQVSSYIQKALEERTVHGIFGYSDAMEGYIESVKGWMKRHYSWEVSTDWMVRTPGVVFALATAVRSFTGAGESVLIQPPVYYPFRGVIESNGRKVVRNPLIYGEDNRYHMDFDDFEDQIIKENVKMFILCNPHNPVGRVWTEEELVRIGDICLKHHVIVVSDEIHADFVFKGRHHVFSSLKKEYEEISVICTAPSKTFNIAGLQVSNIFIPNPVLRDTFKMKIKETGYGELNAMGLIACETAYRDGDEWYEAMHEYVRENVRFAKEYVEKNIPEVTMAQHEGTYLIWLDFRKLALTEKELEEMVIHRAKLWLDGGEMFGEEGRGFQRINVACPRKTLEKALEQLKRAVLEVQRDRC